MQIFQIHLLTKSLVKWPLKPETLTWLVHCDKLVTLQACVIINNDIIYVAAINALQSQQSSILYIIYHLICFNTHPIVSIVTNMLYILSGQSLLSSAMSVQIISRIPKSNILSIEILLWWNRFRFRFVG